MGGRTRFEVTVEAGKGSQTKMQCLGRQAGVFRLNSGS